tara:strand:+ start:1494 stop:1889 length:396 start_codon:yes stop_codon:yes gene_type:complete
MTNYKKKYDKLKVEYDIIKRGKGGKKSLKPDELFTTLQSLYIDKLERMNDQQNLLSKQATILIEKDKQIERNDSILKSNIMKIDTNKRKTIYNEKDDSNTRSYVKILNWILAIFTLVLIAGIGKLIKEKYY